MSRHDVLEVGEYADNGIQFTATDTHVDVSVNDEWSGDSETGLGATVSYQLRRDDVEAVVRFLSAWLGRAGG